MTRVAATGDRVIGWLCLVGLGALVPGLFLTFADRADGSGFRLADNAPWEQLWVAAVTGLAGLAAVCLLVPGRSAVTGRFIVLGICPAVVATGLSWAAFVASPEHGARSGFVLYEVGSVCLVMAACLSAVRLQDIRLVVPRSLPAAAPTIAALVIGTVAATAIGVRAELTADPSGADEVLSLAREVVLLAAAVVIPVLATLLLPRRNGAVLLGAWATSLSADRAFEIIEPMNAPAALAAALAAALLLAYRLGRPR